jgi:hypothetical protein
VRWMATFNNSKRMRWFPKAAPSSPKQPRNQTSPTSSEPSPSDALDDVNITDPFNVSQQSKLSLLGTRLTGEPRLAMSSSGLRYMAPVYFPLHLQAGIMPALLSDPWPTAGENEQRKKHARLIVDFLRERRATGGGLGMTARSILDEINAKVGRTFSSEAYVKSMLEHLRVSRMVKASLNPTVTAARAAGHASEKNASDPLLYAALPHQQEEYGSPAAIAIRNRVKQRKQVELAYRRLRRGKPPHPINRRMSYDSAFSHELGRLEIDRLSAKE